MHMEESFSLSTTDLSKPSTIIYMKSEYEMKSKKDCHKSRIECIGISRNDEYLASGDEEGKIILWQLQDYKIFNQYQAKGPTYCLMFSANNLFLAAGSKNGILFFRLNNKFKLYRRLIGHSLFVYSLGMTNDSKYMISGSRDGTVKIWGIKNACCYATTILKGDIYGISISNSQQYMSCNSWYGLSYIFNISKLNEPNVLVEWRTSDYPICTAFTPDSQSVIITDKQGVRVWKIDQLLKYKEAKPYKIFDNSLTYYSRLSLDGSILCILGTWKIILLDYETNKEISSLDLPELTAYQKLEITSGMKYIIKYGKNNLYKFEKIELKL